MAHVAGVTQQSIAYGLLGVTAGLRVALPCLEHTAFISPAAKNSWLKAHLRSTPSKPSYKDRKEAAVVATRALLNAGDKVVDAAPWVKVLDEHKVKADLADSFLLALSAMGRQAGDKHAVTLVLDVGFRHLGVCVLANAP